MPETTEVSQVEINLDELVQEHVSANAANVIIPAAPILKKPVEEDHLAFLEGKNAHNIKVDGAEEEEEEETAETIIEEAVTETLTEEKVDKGGRPALTKDLAVDVINSLVEDGEFMLFDDGKDLSQYTKQDLIELIKVNMEEKQKSYEKEIPLQFFDSLPEKLQYAAKYVADGGKDLESMFKVLLQQERIENLDPESEAGQRAIATQYLELTDFGTPEQIQEEVTGWLDRGELPKKAAQFQPKLEARNKETIEREVKKQEAMRKQQEAASEAYVANVYETLKDGELEGLKLDKKTQALLYTGLVQANYKSYTGQPTNLLGHLLEKYQVIEPNHALVSQALWLLSDPEGFKAKIRAGGEKAAVEKTVRALKTEQSTRTTQGPGVEENNEQKKVVRTISRPTGPAKFKRA